MSTTPRVTIEHEPASTLAERAAAGDPPSTDAATARPSFERIAEEAYAIYLANGAQDGHDQDDWLEAERRVAARGEQAERQQSTTERQQEERHVRQPAATEQPSRVGDRAMPLV